MRSGSARVGVVAAVAAGVLVLGACSSSSSQGGGESGGTSGGSSGSTGPAPSGATITIGSFTSLTNPEYSAPQVKAAMEAAVSDVNAHGGIKGHKLVLDFCDSDYDANQELSCTRSLIADKVSALVAPQVLADSSGREYTAAAQAKVPVIGGQGLSVAELTSPVAFPLASGIPGWVYGATQHLLGSGAKKIVTLTDTNPVGQFFVGLVKGALQSAGVQPVAQISGDPTSDPTLATAAGKVISSGADGVVLIDSPPNIPKQIVALKQAGYTGKISTLTALMGPPVIKALGSAANGILLTSQLAFTTDTSNSGVQEFLADMKKYQPSVAIDESAEDSWAAVMLFAKVGAGLSDFSSTSVLDAFTNLSTPIDLGLAPPFAVKGRTSPVAEFPRVFSEEVQNGTVENGEVQPDGKGFVNPYTALKGS